MSYYYKYNFISPESVYATVKEELKSYFDTGAVDDLLFPTYLDKCLRKLGRSSYVISEDILDISDFQARLPDNFIAVREAWMCTEIPLRPYQDSTSFYSQASSQTTIQISTYKLNIYTVIIFHQSNLTTPCFRIGQKEYMFVLFWNKMLTYYMMIFRKI